jgi:GTP pyrophosphokinase
VPIRITAFDRHGLMVDITNLISNEGLNITNIGVQMKKDKFQGDVAELYFTIEVQSLEQLSSLLNRIENLPNVLEAQRIRAG